VKAQRDHLLNEVRSLNRQTAELREIKKKIRQENRLENWSFGEVKWFDQQKGYGFITQNNNRGEIYFNKRQLKGVNVLYQGDQVKFVIRQGDRPWAAKVTKV
jgi:CspA family cold shock protein